MATHLRRPPSTVNWWLTRTLLYEDTYLWLALATAIDVVLTWSVLIVGGNRANWLGNFILETAGVGGLAFYRVALFLLAVVICEEVGRRRPTTGRRIAQAMTLLAWVPVCVGAILLVRAL